MLEGCHSWPDELSALYREQGYWEDRTISDVIDAAIRRSGDKTALIFPGESVSYRTIGQMTDRLAHHFVALGIRPRDRVVFQLDSSVYFMPTLLALLKIGAIPVLALPSHRDHEIDHFLAFSGASAYVVPDVIGKFDFRDMAQRMQSRNDTLKTVLVAGDARGDQVSIPALLQEAAPGESEEGFLDGLQSAPDDVALMLLSGGTTAIPKLIPRTHNDYVYNFKQSGAVAGFDSDTVLLAVLPLAHNYTLASPGVLSVMELGGQVVFSASNKPEEVFPCVERHRVTNINAAVPLFNLWLNSEIPSQYDLSSLRAVMNGGARLAPKLRHRAEETFGCRFMESFGTGEGLLMQSRPDDCDEIRMNSSGKPVSPGDEIKVVDEDGNELPDGETGELLVRGPYTIRGYYNSPENDKKAFTPDGFYRMGDTVYKLNGYIYAEGRKKDLINRGGEKISVEEVENLVLAHPSVQGVAIVAMPDPVFGEKACAFVKLCSGARLSFEQLQNFLLDTRIAKFKLPERLEIVDEFPISPAGKILRKELRERIKDMITKEGKSGLQ